MVCSYGTYVSVRNNEAGYLVAHMSINNHKNAARCGERASKMENFYMLVGSPVGERLAASECTVAYHTFKHHFRTVLRSLDEPISRILHASVHKKISIQHLPFFGIYVSITFIVLCYRETYPISMINNCFA